MSKFIKVTLYGTEVISAIAVSEVTSIGDGGVYTKNGFVRVNESLEQIEAQLLRDEFAMEIAGSLFSRKDLNIWEHIVRDNAQSHTQKRIIEESYKIADAMLKERSK